jgi:hypothetical protein
MKEKDVEILIIVTFIVFFFPQFQSQFGLFFEQALTILVCMLSIVILIINNKSIINVSAVNISVIYCFLLAISIMRSLDIFIASDLFELAKPLYFCSFFLLGYNVKWNNRKLKVYFSALMTLLLLAAIIGIGESISSTINEITKKIYKGDRQVLSHKAIFSFISPYTFGTVLLLPVFYYFTRITRTRNKNIIIDIAFFSLFFSCFILTQSRTIFISFIGTVFIMFIVALYNKWYPFRKNFIIIISLTILTTIILMQILIQVIEKRLSYLYIGLNVLFNSLKYIKELNIEQIILSNKTIAIRYEQFLFAVEQQGKIPLIGIGIGKAVLMPETFYTMYYYRVGIIGICIHFGFIIYSIYWSLYFAKKYSQLKIYNKNITAIYEIFLSIAIYFMSFFISYFSSAVNDQTRSGFIFYILFSILCYYKRNYRSAIIENCFEN